MKTEDYFNYSDSDLYELMHEQGKERFGSECKHEYIRNGKCLNCFRKVVSKLEVNHVNQTNANRP